MSFLDALGHRLGVLLRPRAFDDEMEEEMRFHLALEAMQRESASRGTLSTSDARLAARRRFGNTTCIKEERRRMTGLGFFDLARQDLRFALRTFRRTPGFTVGAVLTLAIGIGANTAIFTIIITVLLRSLPVKNPEELVQVVVTSGSPRPAHTFSYPFYERLRDNGPACKGCSVLAAWDRRIG